MPDREVESTVTFHHPVVLRDFETPQAAGTYRLVYDMQEIQGLSFVATRRTGIRLHLPALSVSALPTSIVTISQGELDAMIKSDANPR
ncbi:hypothetical protein [Pleomorphomonas oryzae]|uniref:hypothetical protein n=1 Tax=Pleomorphomonas oryzae TaxID=261934 RepID=UPI000405DD0D|nr:hypothetical protein [Pleomorphomonas oryzae]